MQEEKIEEIQEMDLKVAPVQKQERIETLDIIRGFALLGILVGTYATLVWNASIIF